MDVRDENKNIVYIGATDIDTSLSCMLRDCNWIENILFALFQWLSDPKDIDGDGDFTITDLYKFVAYYTNQVIKEFEKIQTQHLIDISVRLGIDKTMSGQDSSLLLQIEKEAEETLKNYIIPHQSTWMLNAIAAANMRLE